jgi:hypothetical protein
LLERRYAPVASGLGTVIYERRPGSPSASSP